MRLREQSHLYHIQETISIFKHGIAVFQALVIDGSLAADELGADTGGQHNGLADVVLLETDGNGHLLQMSRPASALISSSATGWRKL